MEGYSTIYDHSFFIKFIYGRIFTQIYPGAGIIYCRKRDDCTLLAAELLRRGVMAKPYHAGRLTILFV